MLLAQALREDTDAVICDLAETYHIFNYKALPVRLLATLFCGLGPDSRIKKKLAGREFDSMLLLLLGVVDRLSILIWQQTENGRKNRNQPESILGKILGNKAAAADQCQGYASGEEYETARAALLKGGDASGNRTG